MKHYKTNAAKLEVDDDDFYTIPKGKAGTLDREGRRRVVWQRDGRNIYLVCPGCGRINEVDLVNSYINVRDLEGGDCFVCHGCQGHYWITLAGAGGWFFKKLKKDQEHCPSCSGDLEISSSGYSYVRKACDDCGIEFDIQRKRR